MLNKRPVSHSWAFYFEGVVTFERLYLTRENNYVKPKVSLCHLIIIFLVPFKIIRWRPLRVSCWAKARGVRKSKSNSRAYRMTWVFGRTSSSS